MVKARQAGVVYCCICGDLAMTDVWYRYDDSDIDWTRDPYEWKIPVKRYTAKCVVLDVYGREKFVLLDARKRWAYPTRELALESYIIRKQRQISWTAAAHDRAKDNLKGAEEFKARGMEKETFKPNSLSFI